MTSKLPSLDEIRAKHAAELAEAERRHAVQIAVTDALKLDASEWSAGSFHAYRADCFIVRTAPDLSAAIEMAERMNPEPMAKVTGSSTSFVPLARVSAKEEADERTNVETVCPYRYELDGGETYPQTKTLRWYVKAAGYIVEVRCTVQNDPDTFARVVPVRDNRNRIVEWRRELTNNSGHFPRVVRWWESPGSKSPGKFTLYC